MVRTFCVLLWLVWLGTSLAQESVGTLSDTTASAEVGLQDSSGPVEDEPFVSVVDSLAAAELVVQARELAAADRHHAAVETYLAALALDIRLIETIAQGIAYQRLWREDAERAIFYFRRHLIRNPAGVNREVRKGLALALSWSGRQKEATVLYRNLVAEDPGDGSARIGLGRTMIWDNKLRKGFKTVHEVEKTFPEASEPGRESSRFLLKVLDEYSVPWKFRTDWSRDSDDLEILRLTAAGALELEPSLLLLVIPSWAHYEQGDNPSITDWRLGGGLLTPLAHNWALHVYGWLDLFRSSEPLFNEGNETSWNQPGTDFWFTWLPAAKWRIDFGGSVIPIETVPSLGLEITSRTASASADWRFKRHWSLGFSGQASGYSDDNERLYGTARLGWKSEGRVEVLVAPVFTYLDFKDHYPGHGYWSPSWMRNGSLEAIVKTRWDSWTLYLSGKIGREKEVGANAMTVGGAAGRVGWRVTRNSLLALEGGYSKSSLASPGGFSRHFFNLSWRSFF